MIDAIIFDFDGTILETELPDYLSWQEAYAEHGCELPLEQWLKSVGGAPDSFDPYAFLEAQVGGPVDRMGIRQRRGARFLELIASEPIRPGVVPLITAAEKRGIRLAVASSSDGEWVWRHLRERGLAQHFPIVRTADDVQTVKPNPELYLSAACGLGIVPERALAIEDSLNGVLAAKAAGMKCLAVPNAVTRGLIFTAADTRVDSLAEVTLDDLLATLGQSAAERGK